jgi:hypothetical protein
MTTALAAPAEQMGLIIQRDDEGHWHDLRAGTLAEARQLNVREPVFPDEDPRYGWVPHPPET